MLNDMFAKIILFYFVIAQPMVGQDNYYINCLNTAFAA